MRKKAIMALLTLLCCIFASSASAVSWDFYDYHPVSGSVYSTATPLAVSFDISGDIKTVSACFTVVRQGVDFRVVSASEAVSLKVLTSWDILSVDLSNDTWSVSGANPGAGAYYLCVWSSPDLTYDRTATTGPGYYPIPFTIAAPTPTPTPTVTPTPTLTPTVTPTLIPTVTPTHIPTFQPTATPTPSGGGSGGGCSTASISPGSLLLGMPLFFLLKRASFSRKQRGDF